MLITILSINEICKLLSLFHLKRKLKLSSSALGVILISFPLAPAILLYTVLRLSHQKTSRPRQRLTVETKIWNMRKILTRMKRNENALENFPQLVIFCVIILIVCSQTTPIASIKMTIDTQDTWLYITACLSFVSIIIASVSHMKASFQGRDGHRTGWGYPSCDL